MQRSNRTISLTLVLLFLLPTSSSSFPAPSQQTPASRNCSLSQQCGAAGLAVSYPFALADRSGCAGFSPFFQLHCDEPTSKVFINISRNSYSTVTPVEVTHITSDSLIVDITSLTTYTSCYNDTTTEIYLPLFPGPFLISEDNWLVSFGCTVATLLTANLVLTYNMTAPSYSSPAPAPAISSIIDNNKQVHRVEEVYELTDLEVSGCAVSCLGKPKRNPECGNRTCCLSNSVLRSASRYASITVGDETPLFSNMSCDPEGGLYGTFFHPNYTDFGKGSYQLKLKWALPSDQIQNINAMKQSPDYACSPNSNITIIDEVPGYLCSCNPGYTGDGYLKGSGCHDINECDRPNDCVFGSRCQNVEGNYTCSCHRRFYVGDGRMSGSGCQFPYHIKLAIAISSGG